MKCHYEVLGLERTATSDEIKKAYRKLALKWHPDKNVGNEAEATARFKEVTAAQTVLSDPHERKWYDDHREAILRGGSGTSHGSADDDSPIINLWPFFNSNCFSGFDGPDGFFTVYGNLFKEIHEIDGRDIPSDSQNTFYSFGCESSDQAEVFQFYVQWSNFVTQLSFSWEDEYNTLEAPNRFVKRAMEKDNKKKRDAGRKKYMETVRALVDYVKKRDIRYIRFEREVRIRQQEEEAARKRKNLERKEQKQQQRKQLRQQMQNEFEEEELLRVEERRTAFLLADMSDDDAVEQVNAGNDGMIEEDSDSSEEHEEIIFACDICKKEFKTEAQQQQHFTSKVHRKKAQDFAKQEKAKAAKMNSRKGKGSAAKQSVEGEPGVAVMKEENTTTKSSMPTPSNKKKKKKAASKVQPTNTFAFDSDSSDSDSASGSDNATPTVSTQSKKTHMKHQKQQVQSTMKLDSDSDGDSDSSESSSSDEDDILKLSQINLSKQDAVMSNVNDLLQQSKIKGSEQDNVVPNLKAHNEDISSDSDSDSDSDGDSDSGDGQHAKPEMNYEIITPGGVDVTPSAGGAHATKTHQGRKQGGQASTTTKQAAGGGGSSTVCMICGYDAQGSRNKLFQHVKDFGHAALKEDVHASASGGGGAQQTAVKMSKKDRKKKKFSTEKRKNDYRS